MGSRTSARLVLGLCLLAAGLTAVSLWLWLLAGATVLMVSSAGSALWIALAVPFAVVGALILRHRPGNRIGWLLLGLGLTYSGWRFAFSCGLYALDHGEPPGTRLLLWLTGWLWVPPLLALVLLLLVYPTGRLVSQRWRPVVWATVVLAGLTAATAALTPRLLATSGPANPVGLPDAVGTFLEGVITPNRLVLGWAALLLAAVGSLVVRLRRSQGVERQQLKWFVWAAAVAALGNSPLGWWFTLGVGSPLSLWIVPAAIGVAVTRYRLYDIDRVVSRTLTYGLLTVLLGLVYVGGVFALGQVLNPGGESAMAVAASTLAVAALFRPARRRVQGAVDRRFNRRRHDTATTIGAFSTRLREQVDLDTLTAELLAVVNQTMEPTRLSLWLRPPAERPAAGHR